MDLEDRFAGNVGGWKDVAKRDVIVGGWVGKKEGEARFKMVGED